MDNSRKALKKTALNLDLPDWATHVAVANFKADLAYPCMFSDELMTLVSNDTSALKNIWDAITFTSNHWEFFEVSMLYPRNKDMSMDLKTIDILKVYQSTLSSECRYCNDKKKLLWTQIDESIKYLEDL